MSYEGDMLTRFGMPTQKAVEQALLRVLLQNGGTITEFGSGEKLVEELANEFELNEQQRSIALETIYRKEGRLKKSLLWHRLLFRSADSLAKQNLVSRPTHTLALTGKREWMLTEKGFDEALKLSNIPAAWKEVLPTKSFEVEKIVKKLMAAPRRENYNPVDANKPVKKTARQAVLRSRSFRLAVAEAYKFRCAMCGLKMRSPDALFWEVESAHIVPNRLFGRDDVCNGIALCRFHHWAFDLGWFTLSEGYGIRVSPKVSSLPDDYGRMHGFDVVRSTAKATSRINLPASEDIYPHPNSILWHNQNVFCK
ncbi:MAG TPA: HNH endonuclease [Verrucomicrobiae bacterium]|nr:HNH endonuclease [Verrucomicrobiae bacterium]